MLLYSSVSPMTNTTLQIETKSHFQFEKSQHELEFQGRLTVCSAVLFETHPAQYHEIMSENNVTCLFEIKTLKSDTKNPIFQLKANDKLKHEQIFPNLFRFPYHYKNPTYVFRTRKLTLPKSEIPKSKLKTPSFFPKKKKQFWEHQRRIANLYGGNGTSPHPTPSKLPPENNKHIETEITECIHRS